MCNRIDIYEFGCVHWIRNALSTIIIVRSSDRCLLPIGDGGFNAPDWEYIDMFIFVYVMLNMGIWVIGSWRRPPVDIHHEFISR